MAFPCCDRLRLGVELVARPALLLSPTTREICLSLQVSLRTIEYIIPVSNIASHDSYVRPKATCSTDCSTTSSAIRSCRAVLGFHAFISVSFIPSTYREIENYRKLWNVVRGVCYLYAAHLSDLTRFRAAIFPASFSGACPTTEGLLVNCSK